MTRRPVEPVRVGSGSKEPIVKLPKGQMCQSPDCDYLATDRHHCVPGGMGGPRYDWLEIDGVLRQNVVFLCALDHHDITVNKARIVWDDGEWCWNDYGNSLSPALDTALPPSSPPEDPVSPPVVGERSVEHRTGLTEGVESTRPVAPAREIAQGEQAAPSVSPGQKCGTCGRRVNHPKKKESPKDVKQLNLGPGPADTVARLRDRVDDAADAIGLTDKPFHRVRMVDLMLVLVESVSVDTLKGMVDELPWAA